MQYHLFSGCVPANLDRWIIFLYKGDTTCVQTWEYHPKYGTDVRTKTREFSIKTRIFILGTDQHGKTRKQWEHKKLTENEALEKFFGDAFIK